MPQSQMNIKLLWLAYTAWEPYFNGRFYIEVKVVMPDDWIKLDDVKISSSDKLANTFPMKMAKQYL